MDVILSLDAGQSACPAANDSFDTNAVSVVPLRMSLETYATQAPTLGERAMGDWFQSIVDTEATSGEAQGLAARVLDWLIADGFVSAERTDCVLGADAGHPPGPRSGEAVEDPDPELGNLWSNGLHITVGRTVFDSGQGEPSSVTCPHCATELPLVDKYWSPIEENWARFAGAVGSWAERDDEPVACPSCERAAPVHTWLWTNDYFAFGNLGFTFWNWPTLRPEFVADFSRRLDGHRTVLLEGKL